MRRIAPPVAIACLLAGCSTPSVTLSPKRPLLTATLTLSGTNSETQTFTDRGAVADSGSCAAAAQPRSGRSWSAPIQSPSQTGDQETVILTLPPPGVTDGFRGPGTYSAVDDAVILAGGHTYRQTGASEVTVDVNSDGGGTADLVGLTDGSGQSEAAMLSWSCSLG